MAKIQEQVIIIKISTLLKDDDTEKGLLSADVVANLEAVAQELVGNNAVVEVQVA